MRSSKWASRRCVWVERVGFEALWRQLRPGIAKAAGRDPDQLRKAGSPGLGKGGGSPAASSISPERRAAGSR